ncbi:ABC transporter permease [Flammeovirga sp. EKP202]|uniref:ABC transporter permease n=1 Tax=Flammeovirga sp. EKP202 TaxID=2770592 RepID=UPI00165F2596|nr:ABC transporter permease [Flammeovirga sp. EKP202]MBD0403167.1 ABC transporter permease [Flammeovirga sp. EKP202]
MYKIYFNLAVRNLIKNYQNTLINLLGLSLGLASALFIFLFFHLETNFDNFYKDDIYRITHKRFIYGDVDQTAQAFYPEGGTFLEKIENINEMFLISNPNPSPIYILNQRYADIKMAVGSANYFSFFGIELLRGDAEKVLQANNSAVITASMAEKVFGKADPIGQEIELYGTKLFIEGIIPDRSVNSHLQFDVLFPEKWLSEKNGAYLGWNGGWNFNVYIKLLHDDQKEATITAMNKILDEVYPGDDFSIEASLQTIESIHLNKGLSYDTGNPRSAESLWIIIAAGCIILSLALLNFVVLYTAQKDEEIHSLTLMKIYGAHHRDLWISTCLEVFLMVGIATLISICTLNISLPFLNAQLVTRVFLSNYIPSIIGFYTVIGVVLTMLLSSLSLRGIKKSSLSKSLNGQTSIYASKGWSEKALLVFQFSTVFVLSCIGITVYQQHYHLLHKDLGFQHQNVFTIDLSTVMPLEAQKSFKEKILKKPGIETVSMSSQMIGVGLTKNGYSIGESEKSEIINALYVSNDFLECFDIPLLEGENLHTNKNISDRQILVNEAFKKLEGWNGLGTIVHRGGRDYEVVGVIPSISFNSLAYQSGPLVIGTSARIDGWNFDYINIKTSSKNPYQLANEVLEEFQKDYPDVRAFITFYNDEIEYNYNYIKSQQQANFFFGCIALLIAISGLWGITRFSVLKRTKEMSIRRVNGASRLDILKLFNRDYLQWIALSFLLAMPIANYFGNDWLSSFPDRIGIEYVSWVMMGVVVVVISVITITLICWKIVNMNPSQVLRDL